MDEVLAGRPELRQVGEHGLVRGDELSGAPEAEPAAALLRRECDRQVGADARERVERGLLRVVEPARERRDRNHERDAEREPEHSEDRPRLPPKQLVAKVGEVEHEPSKAGAAKSRLRPPTPVRSSHVRVPGQRDRSVTTDPQIAASRLDERPAAARAMTGPAMARCQTKVTEASRKRDGSAPGGGERSGERGLQGRASRADDGGVHRDRDKRHKDERPANRRAVVGARRARRGGCLLHPTDALTLYP